MLRKENMIMTLTLEQHSFIFSSLNNPKELRLIFRASEHQFKAQAFLDVCKEVEDTLTIVRT
jgi:hypothetical protein